MSSTKPVCKPGTVISQQFASRTTGTIDARAAALRRSSPLPPCVLCVVCELCGSCGSCGRALLPETGLPILATFTESNYLHIIALDANTLQIDAETLSTALFRMLSSAAKQRSSYSASDSQQPQQSTCTSNASVTHSLGSTSGSCIQRRSLVIARHRQAATTFPT